MDPRRGYPEWFGAVLMTTVIGAIVVAAIAVTTHQHDFTVVNGGFGIWKFAFLLFPVLCIPVMALAIWLRRKWQLNRTEVAWLGLFALPLFLLSLWIAQKTDERIVRTYKSVIFRYHDPYETLSTGSSVLPIYMAYTECEHPDIDCESFVSGMHKETYEEMRRGVKFHSVTDLYEGSLGTLWHPGGMQYLRDVPLPAEAE